MSEKGAGAPRYESSTDIAAPAARVWEVWADVTHWPEWTASVTGVEPLDGPGPLRVGARYRLRQPRVWPAVWTVTELVEGHRFTWTSSAPGLHTVATHVVDPVERGARATAAVELAGPLRQVARTLLGRLVERYVALEIAGIKARCQQRPPQSH